MRFVLCSPTPTYLKRKFSSFLLPVIWPELYLKNICDDIIVKMTTENQKKRIMKDRERNRETKKVQKREGTELKLCIRNRGTLRKKKNKQTNSVALSPRANYTD
jgi:hypothetical protein